MIRRKINEVLSTAYVTVSGLPNRFFRYCYRRWCFWRCSLAGSLAVDDAPITAADYGGEDGQINSFYELMSFAIANFMQYMIGIAVVVGVLWILAGYLGARKKRPEEKAMEKQVSMLVDKIGKMKEK